MMANDHIPSSTELLVIGGGPGGYAAAIRAGQLDADVTLVDDTVGGTCLNYGCIPSKALISATSRVWDAAAAEEMGIYADPYVDVEELMEWKDGIITQLTNGVAQLCAANGVELVDGRAKFVDETTARIIREQDSSEIDFEKVIVATGSKPIDLPGFNTESDCVLTSREALSPSSVPDRLVVLGGGYIGMELAFVYAKLGTAVTVIEMLDDILPGFDASITQVVRQQADEHGIAIQDGTKATRFEKGPDDVVVETSTDDGLTDELTADSVLVAVGREPVTDTVDLDSIDVATSDGFIEVDKDNRTSLDHVFAVGDVAGEPMLAHKAHHEGIEAAETIAGGEPTSDFSVVPAVIFTDPEIGVVGETPEEVRERGVDPIVGKFSFGASGRALAAGEACGFVRIVAEPENGTVVGSQIVGPEASELVAELTLAINNELPLSAVADAVHAHPTFSETVMEAAAGALNRSIHGGQ